MFPGCNVANHSKAAVQTDVKMTFMVQQHHPRTKPSPRRSTVGINHQGLICTSWFHWLCKKKMEIGSHLNHMWCNKMNPCFSLAASHQPTNIEGGGGSFLYIYLLKGLKGRVSVCSSSLELLCPENLCYLFFFLSFLPLLVELWVVLERAEAWPVVFRWSNNLFLEGNSLSQVTQWRFTSF